MSPIPALDEFFPGNYPGIYVLLHIASDGVETIIRVANGNDICKAIDLECINPLVACHGPTHVAVQFNPTQTPEEVVSRRIETARYHARFQPAA